MKKINLHLWIFFCLSPLFSIAQNDTLAMLLRNSYRVFELQRNEIGVYRDSKVFEGADFHPSSIANVGMGLVSLAVAHALDFEPAADQLALISLKSMTGHTPGFQPDRNQSGFFRHFVDMETGANAWNSEYSSIETALLMCGAFFCKNYFSNNDSIAHYADELWQSIDWSKAIADPGIGAIYLEFDEAGNGIPDSITLPYSEYILVAWMALLAETNESGPAHQLWGQFYANPSNLLQLNYGGFSLLTDVPEQYQSGFTLQFPYYLCHYYTTHPAYFQFMNNGQQADRFWWQQAIVGEPYEWGLGAGSYGFGYHADAINNNPGYYMSPHIIAGYLPVYPNGAIDLLQLFEAGNSVYTLPSGEDHKILWRISLEDPNWRAQEVQGVDFSSFLFGLASLPEFLGPGFFSTYNDFEPTLVATSIIEKEQQSIKAYPNPANNEICLEWGEKLNSKEDIIIEIYDVKGKMIKTVSGRFSSLKCLTIDDLFNGLYFFKITYNNKIAWLNTVVK